MHLQPMKAFREAGEVDPLVAIAGGGGVCLCNSMGNPWTADYLKITGELDVDLRSNIAAEARAKIVYERLINFCEDTGTLDALQFLMTREITHMKAFAAALESMQKPAFSIGQIPPTPDLVNKYFNDSTGKGDDGEVDARGPWNEGDDWEYVEAPAFQDFRSRNGHAPDDGEAFPAAEMLKETLLDGLRDLLHAEGQLVKALPKMAKAARSSELRNAFKQHLAETEGQVQRLKEVFRLLEEKATPKPCKGMAGLVEEGEEVITEGKEKEDVAADLSIIAAAQKVEHYEIASYLSARALASQAGEHVVARLLGQSLLEEEMTDKLLNRLATLLMEQAGAEDDGETKETDGEASDDETDAAIDSDAVDGVEQDGNGKKRPKVVAQKPSGGRRR